jgi:hypothetical protein
VIERSPYAAYEAFAPGAGAFRSGFGCFIDPSRIDPELGVRWATSAGAFGTNAFIDLDRRLTGVLFTENRERWPVPGGAGAYNPSTRAFLAEIRPRIEAALPEWCGPADLVAPAGVVSAGDLAALVAGWGGSSRDLDGDGVVGAADLAILVGSWGACQ